MREKKKVNTATPLRKCHDDPCGRLWEACIVLLFLKVRMLFIGFLSMCKRLALFSPFGDPSVKIQQAVDREWTSYTPNGTA